MGSNPTPRAYLGYLYENVNNQKIEFALRKKDLVDSHVDKPEESIGTEVAQKITSLTKSCSKLYFYSILAKLAVDNVENANIICDYLIAEETEINIKNSTKEGRIKILVWLSHYHINKKSFKQMTKHDILDFLNNLRKPLDDDPYQKWIGSYNGCQIILNKFFRWLYNPLVSTHNQRTNT